MFYIYILYSPKADKFYIGYSNDPFRRVDEHNSKPFNTFTAKHRPWIVKAVFQCSGDERVAMRIEKFIKQQKSRKLVERLIDPGFITDGALAQLVRVPHVRD